MPADDFFNPFDDFINHSLDMAGIDGFDSALIAERVQALLRQLPTDDACTVWNERLDQLQSLIRMCLDVNMILSAFEAHPEPDQFNRDDLEIVAMLAVTFAFMSYNQLRPDYHPDGLARRLRRTLTTASDWVKQAAEAGDPTAQQIAAEIDTLLENTQGLD